MIDRLRVMLSRCHSHRVCFCVDAGSAIEKCKIEGYGVNVRVTHMIHSLLVATETSVECQVWTLRWFRAIEQRMHNTAERTMKANTELEMERAACAGVPTGFLTSLTRHGYVDQTLKPALTSSV